MEYKRDKDFGIIVDILSGEIQCPLELRSVVKRYRFSNNQLYYAFHPGDVAQRLCIPVGETRSKLLAQAHDSPASGHPGALRTYMMLSPHYYWPRMAKTIKRYCHRCADCQRTKSLTQARAGLHQPLPVPTGRWESISMDFVTGIPKTHDGLDCILVVVDRLTKRAHFIAMTKEATAADCAQLFIDEVFRLHGLPKSLVTDRDTRFTNKFWETLHGRLGISLDMSTPYHPQTDGQTERTNRTMEQLLRPYVNELGTNWALHLPLIEFGYNNAYQASIGMSPFKADLGFEPRFIDLVHSTEKRSEAANDFAEMQEALSREVQESMALAQDRQGVQVNRHRTEVEYEEGDLVLLHKDMYGKFRSNSKLKSVYFGPFKIVKKISNNAYRLDIPGSRHRYTTYNVSNLRRFTGDNLYAKPAPASDEEARARVQTVRSLQGFDANGNMLVNWQGCDPEDITSLPDEYLNELPFEHLKVLHDEFERRQNRAST